MTEKINAIKEYLKHFPSSHEARENLIFYETLEELGMEKKENSYYPRMRGYTFLINDLISVCKNPDMTNHATDFVPNGKDSLIRWHASCGKLEFISSDYWHEVNEEWEWFKSTLKSYNPADYDDINDTYIYELENGKKLIKDYPTIVHQLSEKMRDKITMVKIKRKEEELEQLKKAVIQNDR